MADIICTACGTGISDENKFCTACGALVQRTDITEAPKPIERVETTVTPPAMGTSHLQQSGQLTYRPQQQSIIKPVAETGLIPARGSIYEPISTLGYLGIWLLMLIPVINLLLLIVWACGGCRKINKRNFARSMLVTWLITLVLGAILALVFKSKFESYITQANTPYLAQFGLNNEASNVIPNTASKTASGKNVKTALNSGAVNAMLKDSDINALMQMGDPKYLKWPKDVLHPNMPEYKKGKLNGWAPWDPKEKDSIFILIRDTSKADLDEYVKKLEIAGFTTTGSKEYHKDLYDISFQMNSDSILQISSYKAKVIKWPDSLSGIPPVKGGALIVVDGANAESPDTMNLYYINLPVENLRAWRQELAKKGYDIKNDSMTAKNVRFKGNTYSQAEIWYEENGTNEWNIYFDFKK